MKTRFVIRTSYGDRSKVIKGIEDIAFDRNCDPNARIEALKSLCELYEFTEEDLSEQRKDGLAGKLKSRTNELEAANNKIKDLEKELDTLKKDLEDNFVPVRRGRISKEDLARSYSERKAARDESTNKKSWWEFKFPGLFKKEEKDN